MSSEEKLSNCVRHTRGFIQTYLLSNILLDFFYKINFQKHILKIQALTTTINVPKKKVFLKLPIL